mgnify:CR=1 FL=1
MGFILRVVVNAIALFVASWLLPGMDDGTSIVNMLLVALVVGLINAIIRPILGLLTCPLQILTLGLFTLVLNAAMLLLLSTFSASLGLQFRVDGWLTAILGAVIVSIVSIILSTFVRDNNERRR